MLFSSLLQKKDAAAIWARIFVGILTVHKDYPLCYSVGVWANFVKFEW
jgi:NO-binding membrane sensor protein with MHYT domain